VVGGIDVKEGRKIIFFDLETQRTFDEVGGRHNLSRLGLAAAVTYDSSTGEYRTTIH
jgi:DEAD/DEAH box helicase domain-containing protein